MYTNTRLLKAKINDLFTLCDKRLSPQFSPFLDGGEIAVIEDEITVPYGYNTMLYGGYEGAERRIFGVFPEWEEACREAFPIAVIRFDTPKFASLTHRDYLGTIMSLGIDRNKTGDIITDGNGAYTVAEISIAEYIINNVKKIANAGVRGHIIDQAEFEPPEPKVREKSCVAASVRLDAVIAAAYNVSRGSAERLVKEGLVKVNHRQASDRSAALSVNDLVSVRGFGRFILKSVGAATGKGRLHITVLKFV